jgi:excisionase family DNA binding protein
MIPRWSVYEYVKAGEIPAMRIGRQIRFRLADIEGWEQGRVEATRQAAERRGEARGGTP